MKEEVKKKNIHAGHRERVKTRFDMEGLDNFSDHQILEFLLFYAIPQKDTNELAHNLLSTFGSISSVLDARPHELEKIVGKGATRLLKLILPVTKRYYLDRENYAKTYNTTKSIGQLAVSYFMGETVEKTILMCFDTKMKLLNLSLLAEGSVCSCDVNFRLLCETALKYNATTVVLAHNHPAGIALPSRDDITVSHGIKELLDNLDILLYDHIVVGNRDFVSLRDSRLLDD